MVFDEAADTNIQRPPVIVRHARQAENAKAKHLYTLLARILAALSCIVILAHAYLLPAGRWQGDEYIMSVFTERNGVYGFIIRIIGWSPRPVAEIISYTYLFASNAFDRPLIGPFLACIWFISLAGIAVSAWIARERRPVELALLWFSVALLVAKPGEMFFWPMGTAAYLPCWAALAAATILQRGASRFSGLALSIALLVAAFCSEIGAVTVLVYVGLLLAFRMARRRFFTNSAPLILPALGALGVCLIVLTHRVQVDQEIADPNSGLAGHWVPSLLAALPSFFTQAFSIEGVPFLVALAVKLALLVSLPFHIVRSNGWNSDNVWESLIWVVALILGAFASVVFAYHQFGLLCCERHDTLREGMVFLAIAAAAGLLGAAFWLPRQLLLMSAIVVLMAFRAEPLFSDWHVKNEIVATRHANWRSGQGQGTSMTLLVGPTGFVTNSDSLPPGHYQSDSNVSQGSTPWYAWGIMTRFNKRSLIIAPIAPLP